MGAHRAGVSLLGAAALASFTARGVVAAEDTVESPTDEPEYGSRGGAFTPFEPRAQVDASLRLRGTLAERHALGRPLQSLADPFARWVPRERLVEPAGGCEGGCDGDALAWADLRLRLRPSFVVSEVLALHATLDALDGRTAGSAPAPLGAARDETWLSGSQEPAPLRVTHAFGEFSKGDKIRVRFGRMPVHFGLGLVDHAALGVDDDQGSVADRVSVEVVPAGRLRAGVALETQESGVPGELRGGVPHDASERDDRARLVLELAWQHSEEQRWSGLEGGQAVADLGARWLHRWQDLSAGAEGVERLDLLQHGVDVWLAVRAGDLRWESEGVLQWGRVRWANGAPETRLRSFGAATEVELRPQGAGAKGRLAAGVASGDPDVPGLSVEADALAAGRRAATFRMHPAYRVDQILWRSLFGAVGGAAYLAPTASWVVTENDYGELFELLAGVVYSRALYAAQAPGDAKDLGVEVDVAVCWRSADGPREDDGYQLLLQYGWLHPLAGLGARQGALPRFTPKDAHQLRAVAAVVYR